MYHQIKGLPGPKNEKVDQEKFLLPDQVFQILAAIDEDETLPHEMVVRDHAIVFMGFHLGLRCGEVGLLVRNSFRSIGKGTAHIRTLKKSPRIRANCPCGRKFRVSVARIGSEYPCPRCGEPVGIEGTLKERNLEIHPEVDIPVPEKQVREYILDYIRGMPKGRQHLFVSHPDLGDEAEDRSLPERSVSRIFNSWLVEAGLPIIYSFHALRHGRGVQLYEATQDLKFVQTCLRHESMATSEIYVHLSPQTVDRFSGELERRVVASGPREEREAAN